MQTPSDTTFRLYDWGGYWDEGEDIWEEWYEETPLTATTGPDGRAVLSVPAGSTRSSLKRSSAARAASLRPPPSIVTPRRNAPFHKPV